MKKIRFKLLLSLAMLAVVFTACEDEFSEKDALDAQQSIDLSVYVFDGYSNTGVENASVTIIKDGSDKTSETNSMGIASFSNVKIGGNMPVEVEKEGYTPVRTMANIDVDNYRQGSYTVNVPVLSLDTNTATIKGELNIQTDLTNDSVEAPPAETKISAFVHMGNVQPVEIMATTNAEGKFEFVVPSKDQGGVDLEIKYPTLTIDQTIAKNRDKGQPEFPATEPSIASIPTVFNPSGNAENVPNSVPSVYAIVPEPSGEGETAVIGNVGVNGDGEISYLNISDWGSGYAADDSVDIAINSLFEGSGAEVTGYINGSGELTNYAIKSPGSGYPTFNNANRDPQQSPAFTTWINNLKSDEIRVIEGHYGSGTYREQEIE